MNVPLIRKKEEFLLDPKIRESFQLGNSIQGLKKRNPVIKIGFTNGKFRTITPSHCVFLSLCKTKCDILVVGLNSDYSLRLLNSQSKFDTKERAFALASLIPVDYVTVFDQDTPHLCISSINPDIVFKGPDYKPNEVVSSGKPVEIINHPFDIHVSDLEDKETPKKYFNIEGI